MSDEDNKNIINIPFCAYESAMDRHERANRRLWVLCIILTVMLLGTNIGWIVYESQFEDVVTTTNSIEAESEQGDAIGIIGNSNGVNDGESKSKTNNN